MYHYRASQGSPKAVVNIAPWCNDKKNAFAAYKLWNPSQHRFACAYHSVPELLDRASADCNEYETWP